MQEQEPLKDSGEWIALFPLPSTVFYPHTLLPLHIFEPRYRQMVSDALKENRQIGMVLLKPGWEADYFGSPPIVSIGCAGVIDRHIRLSDGKYNLVLKGISRFRVTREFGGKLYRRALIERLQDINDEHIGSGPNAHKDELIEHCNQYIRLLPSGSKLEEELKMDSCRTLGHLVDQMAFKLDLTVEQKQSFLEELDVLKRARFIHSVLNMKLELLNLSRIRKELGLDARLN